MIEECSWFKLNNFGLALGMTLEFNTSVAKRLKREVKEFLGLITTFVEVTGKKLVGVNDGKMMPRYNF